MPILFEPSRPAADAMSFALAGEVEVVDTLAGLMRALEQRPREPLVVFGPDADAGTALEFASAQRAHRPALGVVLVRRRLDTTVLGQAMRAGVREVVKAEDLQGLGEACRRSLEVSRQLSGSGDDACVDDERHGRLVTVFSAKGGCGKTTIATNLAASLASQSRARVCLVDLDLAFGDVGITLQLAPDRTLADAAAMLNRVDRMGVSALVTPHPSGLDALLAPVDAGDGERLSAALVSELLVQLKRMYDVVVVDTPPAFSDQVLAALDLTDEFVLLTTLDVPALKNLKLTLETLDVLGYARTNWHIVVNRSDSRVGLSTADVERTLQRKVAAEVPSSRDVPASVNRGVPLVLEQPNHPVSVALRRLGSVGLGRGGATPTAEPAAGTGRRRHARRLVLGRSGVTG